MLLPMSTQRVTDDLDRLLALLPDAVQAELRTDERREQLLEVVLDLGRLPEARYPGRALTLGASPLTRDDLAAVVARIGSFGADNRAGIEIRWRRVWVNRPTNQRQRAWLRLRVQLC